MKISALNIANLFEYASYQGIDEFKLRSLIKESELDVCNPENTVSDSEFLAVYETLIAQTNNSSFGLYYGCYLNIKALGLISQIALHASSIEQVVFILQEYLKSTFPLVTLSAVERTEVYVLALNCSVENTILKNHILDTVFCFMYRELISMLRNEFKPNLELPYAEVGEYSKLLSSKVESGKAHLIQLDRKVLDTEINKKRVKEIEVLLPQFLKMLCTKNHKEFSLQIRNMILSMCCPEIPTFELVSKQFPLSARTIQRKLTEEGQSFRKISDDIKKELSYYLAKDKQIKTQDIAFILGYSEPSAYLHAVKRWETDVTI